ncbi:MAG: hypothetical protein ACXAAH_16570 [Promethearchaeota archaeon]|jgi:hypothetical protein
MVDRRNLSFFIRELNTLEGKAEDIILKIKQKIYQNILDIKNPLIDLYNSIQYLLNRSEVIQGFFIKRQPRDNKMYFYKKSYSYVIKDERCRTVEDLKGSIGSITIDSYNENKEELDNINSVNKMRKKLKKIRKKESKIKKKKE